MDLNHINVFVRITVTDNVEDACIDAVFAEDDRDEDEDGSDSDGYLSEVLDFIMLDLH